MEQIIYSIQHVTKEFPGVKALSDVSIDVRKGEILAVVGENGAGKSTLMNILSGGYAPTSGKIIYEGQELTSLTPQHAQKLGIAMIHQELSLSNALSVAENIFEGRLPKNRLGFVDKAELMQRSKLLLQEVGLPNLDPRTLVRDINVSQQQMVEIAKALSLEAKFLILDEPTSSLTVNEAEYLHQIMRTLKEKGITMLYISHKLDEIMAISDRIVVLRDGQLITTMETAATQIDDMVSSMVGREYSAGYTRAQYKQDYSTAKPILEVNNLNVGKKVKNISFTLYEGELLGITGLVGAGRSEALQAIFGADKRQSGDIYIEGQLCQIHHPSDAIAHGLALVPEGRKLQSLFLRFSVKENITIVSMRQVLSRLKLINRKKEYTLADTYSQRLRVKTPTLDQKIVNLSGGNQQKAVIARWLANHPKILFLDEPTQGIDIGAKNEIYEIIDEMVHNGASVIMVSSEMQENISLCDRILVMYDGEIAGELYHENATEQNIVTLMAGQKLDLSAHTST